MLLMTKMFMGEFRNSLNFVNIFLLFKFGHVTYQITQNNKWKNNFGKTFENIYYFQQYN